jgi:hypothetical protein
LKRLVHHAEDFKSHLDNFTGLRGWGRGVLREGFRRKTHQTCAAKSESRGEQESANFIASYQA